MESLNLGGRILVIKKQRQLTFPRFSSLKGSRNKLRVCITETSKIIYHGLTYEVEGTADMAGLVQTQTIASLGALSSSPRPPNYRIPERRSQSGICFAGDAHQMPAHGRRVPCLHSDWTPVPARMIAALPLA